MAGDHKRVVMPIIDTIGADNFVCVREIFTYTSFFASCVVFMLPHFVDSVPVTMQSTPVIASFSNCHHQPPRSNTAAMVSFVMTPQLLTELLAATADHRQHFAATIAEQSTAPPATTNTSFSCTHPLIHAHCSRGLRRYTAGGLDRVSFTWGLSQAGVSRPWSDTEPMSSPGMAGGLFAMNRCVRFLRALPAMRAFVFF
jgi:hypothetical protein